MTVIRIHHKKLPFPPYIDDEYINTYLSIVHLLAKDRLVPIDRRFRLMIDQELPMRPPFDTLFKELQYHHAVDSTPCNSYLIAIDSKPSSIIDEWFQHYDATNAYFADQTAHRFQSYCAGNIKF